MNLIDILQTLKVTVPCCDNPEIKEISTLKDAGKTSLSYAVNNKHADDLKKSQAAAVFLPEQLQELVTGHTIPLVVNEPELYIALASGLFAYKQEFPVSGTQNIDPTARVFQNVSMGTDVKIGVNSVIMAGVYLGDHVTVGDNTTIHPNCVIYRNCIIGCDCVIHANTVIGSDGFGYAHTNNGEHVKIEQLGNVIIEDDVEIGSNTSIDRATFKSTIIRKGSKIDNLVHISHNVEVGEFSVIAGQSGVAGSTILGRNVVMAAQSGATGHVKLADFTTIAARGGVSKNTETGKTYAGFPLMEHKEWLKFNAKLSRLIHKNK
jgi:UDP-3-O-[3-hydroxymyristoyl] glucosamine N-acyltransferase